MDSLISTFHIDWHLIVAQAVNFIVVILVLWYFALRPLAKLMDERGKTIAGGLDNAKKQEALLVAQKAEYEAALAEARKEAATILKQTKKEADAKRIEILEKTKEEQSQIVKDTARQLAAEKAKMLDEAKHDIAALVVAATEKVLEGTMTPKIESQLVEKSIREM